MEGFRDRAAGLRRLPFEAKDLPRTPNRRHTWSSRHHGHPLQQAGKQSASEPPGHGQGGRVGEGDEVAGMRKKGEDPDDESG